ncbi:hypothetical protein LR48_Vigan07g115600 [Vigna angularis]|uniref:Uncharacterized protein n=1 Tax=Phaseolus angularis TaxID=3914 RepID=A0A0L9UY12_PHAAN|nr:hypothetical protein LR48_Vigan07g115600 [Vigna angularis]
MKIQGQLDMYTFIRIGANQDLGAVGGTIEFLEPSGVKQRIAGSLYRGPLGSARED